MIKRSVTYHLVDGTKIEATVDANKPYETMSKFDTVRFFHFEQNGEVHIIPVTAVVRIVYGPPRKE